MVVVPKIRRIRLLAMIHSIFWDIRFNMFKSKEVSDGIAGHASISEELSRIPITEPEILISGSQRTIIEILRSDDFAGLALTTNRASFLV